MQRLLTKFILYILVATSILSCGFTDDKSVKDISLYVPKDLNDCKLETDSFELILKEDIQKQLKCLESNFYNFSLYVRSNNRNVINKGDLGRFVKNFFNTNADGIIQALGLLFKINNLLLQDNATEISNKNISPLVQLLISTNKQAVLITKNIDILFNTKNKIQYVKAKNEIKLSISKFSKDVLSIIENKNGTNTKLDIIKIIKDINKQTNKSFTGPSSKNSLLFVKTLFLGGERQFITPNEIKLLLKKILPLANLALNVTSLQSEFFPQDQDQYNFLEKQIRIISSLLYKHKNTKIVFSVDDLVTLIEKFDKTAILSPVLRRDYGKLIHSFKNKVIGGNPNYFSFFDLKKQLLLLEIGLGTFSLTSNINKIFKDIKQNQNDRLFLSKKHEQIRKLNKRYKLQLKFYKKRFSLLKGPMDFQSFLLVLNNQMVKKKQLINRDAIKGLFQLKKLFTGRENTILNRTEFFKILDSIPQFIAHFSDFSIKTKILGPDKKYLYLKKSTKSFSNLLFPYKDNSYILKVDELLAVINFFFEDINFSKFEKTIVIIKNKILSSKQFKIDDQNLRSNDFKFIFHSIVDIFSKTHYNNFAYTYFKKLFKKETILKKSDFSFKDFEKSLELRSYSYRLKQSHKKSFLNLSLKMKYFRNKKHGQAYYGDTIKRTQEGFVESTIINEVLGHLIKGFGSKRPKKNKKTIGKDELDNLLCSFKPLLEVFGFWTTNPRSFANNTILLTDLFGSQSNGDGEIDHFESTEYAGLVVQTYLLGGKMMEQLKSVCTPLKEDGELAFALDCYRNNFFPILFDNGLKYNNYFPKLYSFSIKKENKKYLTPFLKNIETFARDLNKMDRPMGRRDFSLVIGAMLNIESTFLRFDQNKDNIITNFEIDNAYQIYKKPIIKLANLWEWSAGLSRPIFYYMINKMIIPSMTTLLYYMSYWGEYNDHQKGIKVINAKRNHIGKLLGYLVTLSAEQDAEEEEESKEMCSSIE